MPKPRIGVLLSGCGVHDGSEIHEAVLTLLALGAVNARNIDALVTELVARVRSGVPVGA